MNLPILTLALLLALSGCGGPPNDNASTPTPTPARDPATESAIDEAVTQDEESPQERLKVRQLVTEQAAEQFPGWKVEGVSIIAYTGNLYLVSVDISRDRQGQTVHFAARMFVAPDNTTYWKLEPAPKDAPFDLKHWQLRRERREKDRLQSKLDAEGGR